MKAFSLLLAACLLPAGAALAQTVLPSGAVAPSGSVVSPSGVAVSPGTIPGSQPLATPTARDAGRAQGHRRDQKVPGMSREDKKRLRQMSKVEPSKSDKL